MKKATESSSCVSYYKGKTLEVWDVIEDFNMNFNLGNCFKYITRAGLKEDAISDLCKAVVYIEREKLRISGIKNDTKKL